MDAKLAVVEGAIRRHNSRLDAKAKEAEVKKEDGEVKKEDGEAEGETQGEGKVKKEEGAEEGMGKVKHFVVLPETTEEEFMKVIREDEDERLLRLSEEELEEIFMTVSILYLYGGRVFCG